MWSDVRIVGSDRRRFTSWRQVVTITSSGGVLTVKSESPTNTRADRTGTSKPQAFVSRVADPDLGQRPPFGVDGEHAGRTDQEMIGDRG